MLSKKQDHRYALLALLLVFIFNPVFSQRAIDSLKKVLPATRDTARIKTLNLLSYSYIVTNADSAIHYAGIAIIEAGKLGKKKELAKAYRYTGEAWSYKGDSAKSIAAFRKAISINESTGNKKEAAHDHNGLGNTYFKLGNYPPALKSYLKAIKLAEEAGDKREALINYYSVGNIYYFQGDLETAMEYHNRSLALAEEINDRLQIAFCYDNIAAVQMARGDDAGAEINLLKSVKIREEENYMDGLLASYTNLGVMYQNKGKHEQALLYHGKVLSLSEKMQRVYGKAIALINMAEVYSSIGDEAKAIEYYERSIKEGRATGYTELIKAGYKGLATAYSATGDYRNAYKYHVLYSTLNDSVLNESSSKQLAEMRTRFETEKKELEILTLNKDKELLVQGKKLNEAELGRQRMINYSVSLGLLLVGGLAFFIYRGYRQKQVANRLLEEKNMLIEEKNKDITDSINYAKRIQKAILTSGNYMKKHLPAHFVLYKPKDIVSGDFYWAYRTADMKVIIATADCTGHGVPGAFMSMIGASKLSEIVIERKISEPAMILNQLRDEVIKALNPEDADEVSQDGMDISICCFDLGNMQLQYAGANNSIYIIRKGALAEYKPDKFPVGKFSGQAGAFTNNIIGLEKNDRVYTFTDGYADQFGGPSGKKFKYKQLQELLLSIHDQSMDKQKEVLDTTIERWRGKLEQVDDILVIGIHV
jgi:serine phosphatase RsbU (regulator of sigma subunit)/tetratricopeptide (TPR) repeat protein